MNNFKIWIARDKDGTLTIFSERPILKDNEYWVAPYIGTREMNIAESEYYYSELTFENSPQELELIPSTEETF